MGRVNRSDIDQPLRKKASPKRDEFPGKEELSAEDILPDKMVSPGNDKLTGKKEAPNQDKSSEKEKPSDRSRPSGKEKSPCNDKILIVEDDGDISNMILELLTLNGYESRTAYSGTEALLLLEREAFSLILLDLMLPGKDGKAVLHEIRNTLGSPVSVIALSAIGEIESKVDLLAGGADDYMTKPFNNEELLARIQVQLRKQHRLGSGQAVYRAENKDEQKKTVLSCGLLKVDKDNLTAEIGDRELSLTRRELLILLLLMENPKKVFTKSNIYQSVWGDEFWGDDNTVNVHISNLRQKIARIDPEREYIQTVWGIGFKMKEV